MLPVRVKVVSSSPCSLSEASHLLQRFLSADAASDSYARSYVETVALSLDESRSSGARIEGSSDGKEGDRKHLSRSADNAQSLVEGQSPGNFLEMPGFSRSEGKEVRHSMKSSDLHTGGREKSSKKHSKKRRHSAVDMGSEFLSPSEEHMALPLKEDEDMRPMKKKRKKEKEQAAFFSRYDN